MIFFQSHRQITPPSFRKFDRIKIIQKSSTFEIESSTLIKTDYIMNLSIKATDVDRKIEFTILILVKRILQCQYINNLSTIYFH